MQLRKRIGRYELDLLTIDTIQQRTGVKAFFTSLWLWVVAAFTAPQSVEESVRAGHIFSVWPSPGYDVTLKTGGCVHLTVEEKAIYDGEVAVCAATMQVYGMAVGLGLRT